MDVLANLSKLPEVAYIDNPRDGRYNTEAPADRYDADGKFKP